MTSPTTSSTQESDHRSWIPLVVICLGTFMLLVDVMIVNVALPDMSVDLHTSLSGLEWVVDGYALALAALLMIVGSVSDVIGRRRTYLVGLVVFTLASLACGTAPDATMVIAARIVQGAGGAAMFATTVALIIDSYEGRQRGAAFGIWGATAGVAAAAGPIFGGLLTQSLSWRWVFFINLPIGIVTLLTARRALPTDGGGGDRAIDWLGGLAFTVSAASLNYACVRADSVGWGAAETIVLFVVSAAALAAFVAIERRSSAPLLDLSLLHAPFVGSLVASALYRAAAFATFTFASLWLQTVLDLSPIQAGLVTLPMMVMAFVVSAGGGRLLTAAPARYVIAAGLALAGGGDLLQLGLGAGSHWSALIAGFVVTGIGVGILTPTIPAAATGAVPPERAGMASGAVNTAGMLGLAIAIAVYGSIFATRVAHGFGRVGQAAATAHQVAGGGAAAVLAHTAPGHRRGLDTVVHAAVGSALSRTFLIAGLVGLAGALLSLLLLGRRARRSGDRQTPPTNPASRAATVHHAPIRPCLGWRHGVDRAWTADPRPGGARRPADR